MVTVGDTIEDIYGWWRGVVTSVDGQCFRCSFTSTDKHPHESIPKTLEESTYRFEDGSYWNIVTPVSPERAEEMRLAKVLKKIKELDEKFERRQKLKKQKLQEAKCQNTSTMNLAQTAVAGTTSQGTQMGQGTASGVASLRREITSLREIYRTVMERTNLSGRQELYQQFLWSSAHRDTNGLNSTE